MPLEFLDIPPRPLISGAPRRCRVSVHFLSRTASWEAERFMLHVGNPYAKVFKMLGERLYIPALVFCQLRFRQPKLSNLVVTPNMIIKEEHLNSRDTVILYGSATEKFHQHQKLLWELRRWHEEFSDEAMCTCHCPHCGTPQPHRDASLPIAAVLDQLLGTSP